jgi:hypothetical protein
MTEQVPLLVGDPPDDRGLTVRAFRHHQLAAFWRSMNRRASETAA